MRQTQGEIYVLLYMKCVLGRTDLIIYADTSSNSNSLATALLIGSSRPTQEDPYCRQGVMKKLRDVQQGRRVSIYCKKEQTRKINGLKGTTSCYLYITIYSLSSIIYHYLLLSVFIFQYMLLRCRVKIIHYFDGISPLPGK